MIVYTLHNHIKHHYLGSTTGSHGSEQPIGIFEMRPQKTKIWIPRVKFNAGLSYAISQANLFHGTTVINTSTGYTAIRSRTVTSNVNMHCGWCGQCCRAPTSSVLPVSLFFVDNGWFTGYLNVDNHITRPLSITVTVTTEQQWYVDLVELTFRFRIFINYDTIIHTSLKFLHPKLYHIFSLITLNFGHLSSRMIHELCTRQETFCQCWAF